MPSKTPASKKRSAKKTRKLIQTTVPPELATKVASEAKAQYLTTASFVRRLLLQHFYPKAKLAKEHVRKEVASDG